MEPDYSFFRRPKWVISHVLVALLVAAMLVAGAWQIDRHFSRGDRNDSIAARADLARVDVASVVTVGDDISIGESEQFRQVIGTGTYQIDDEVLIRNRTYEGSPGWWVITPLLLDDGTAVAVNRGWIPLSFDEGVDRPGTEAPTGTVDVVGTIQPSRVAEGFQNADPVDGTLTSLARPDVARLDEQLDYDLLPIVLQVAELETDVNALPRPLAVPALDGGPHLSYAVQWFVFTTIALIGYPLVLRRVARGAARSAPEYDDEYDAA